MKKMVILFIIIAILLSIVIFVYPLYKYAVYNSNTGENMADKLRLCIPFYIDESNFFRIPCMINDQYPLDFIVDTKAISLMQEDKIELYDGKYWGKLPFSAKNAYGKKEKIQLYTFNSFKIDTLTLDKPLFQKISVHNDIYDLVGEGILGSNILSMLHWKFSVDEKTVTLFKSSDTIELTKETEGFKKIENGLTSQGIHLNIPGIEKIYKFTLDLGYQGDIEIDTETAEALKQKYPYSVVKSYRKNADFAFVYIFNNIPIEIGNITIANCQLVNYSDINENFIGANFMRRFNFILMYNDYKGHTPQEHLYIQPSKYFECKNKIPYISTFGINIRKDQNKVIVSGITQNGIADENTIQLGEEIISIDNGKFNMDHKNLPEYFIEYTKNKEEIKLTFHNREVDLFL